MGDKVTTIKLHVQKDLPEEVNVETTEQDIQDLEADTDHVLKETGWGYQDSLGYLGWKGEAF